MNKTVLYILSIFLFPLIIVAQECQFVNTISDDNYEPTKLWIEGDSSKLILDKSGKGTIRLQNGITRSIKLPIPKDWLVVKVLLSECLGDLIFICEISGDDAGSGIVVRLDSVNFRIKWKSEIYGFNVGVPLYKDNFLYVTSVGWVGKLNVQNGKYDWQINNLHGSNGLITYFDKPFLDTSNDTIISFPEGCLDLPGHRKEFLQTLKINKYTGMILQGALDKK